MRIAVVVEEYPSRSETFIAREIDALRRLGHLVSVGTCRPGSPLWHGDKPAPIGASSAGALKAFSALLRLGPAGARRATRSLRLLRNAPACDVVLAHFANVPAVVGSALAAGRGCGFAVSVHARDLFVPSAAGLRAAGRARRIPVCSHAGRQQAVEIGLPADRLRVVRHGIPPVFFRVERKPADPPVILAVGRLVPKKGFHTLIDAFARLHADQPSLTLRIIGAGPERPRLDARVRQHALQGAVELAGPARQRRIRAELAAASVLCQPSEIAPDGDRDGIPNALLEAMAVGIPVVGGETGGLPEAVHHGETGLLAPPGDPEALAGALRNVLNHPDRAHRRSEAGRLFVRETFDPRRNASRLAEVLSEAAAPSPESSAAPGDR